jgi:site-specific DNA recombinase
VTRHTQDEYVLYLRKSKGRAGIARQRTVTTAHLCQAGGTVAGEHADTDRTAFRKVDGARPERAGFDAMLAQLRATPGLGVAAWHADRLTRNSEDTEELIRVCAAGGHPVETPRGGSYDLSTATGRKRLRADALDASYEVDHAIERITAAKLEARMAGEWLGGRRPFGYEKDGVTPRPAEAQAVADATRAVVQAGLPVGAVARQWNQQGLRTSAGGRWAPTEASRVLRRARNAGLAEHDARDGRGPQVTGPACWPAIVAEAEWSACKAILENPARRTSPGWDRRHLGSGVYLCGVCEMPLVHTQTGGKGRPMRGVYRDRPRDGGGGHVARDAVSLDAYVEELVLAWLRKHGREALIPPSREREAVALRAEAAGIRASLQTLPVRIGRGECDEEQGWLASREYHARLRDVQARVDEITASNGLELARAADPVAAWPLAGVYAQQGLVNALMTVHVDPGQRGNRAGAKRGESYFDPAYVRIKWKRRR